MVVFRIFYKEQIAFIRKYQAYGGIIEKAAKDTKKKGRKKFGAVFKENKGFYRRL